MGKYTLGQINPNGVIEISSSISKKDKEKDPKGQKEFSKNEYMIRLSKKDKESKKKKKPVLQGGFAPYDPKKKPKLAKKKTEVKKKEIFEKQEFPIKKGRFKGLSEAEYKNEIRRLRKMKAERDKAKKPAPKKKG